jgi:hypothetical protein
VCAQVARGGGIGPGGVALPQLKHVRPNLFLLEGSPNLIPAAESILDVAAKALRDHARARRPDAQADPANLRLVFILRT